jgi:hypothetical protein
VFFGFCVWTEADLQALAQGFLLLVRFRFAFDPVLIRFRFTLDR